MKVLFFLFRWFLALVLCVLCVVGVFFLLGADGVAFLIAWPVVALLFVGAVAVVTY